MKRCQAKSPWRQSLPLSYPAPPHYVPLTARAGMKWAPDRTRVSLGGGSSCAAVCDNSAPRGCTAGMAVIPGCGSQLSVPMALQGVCVSSQGTGVCGHLSGYLHSSTGTGGCVRAGPGGVAALLTASAKPSPVLPAQLGERRNLFELGIRNLLNQQHDLGLRAV